MSRTDEGLLWLYASPVIVSSPSSIGLSVLTGSAWGLPGLRGWQRPGGSLFLSWPHYCDFVCTRPVWLHCLGQTMRVLLSPMLPPCGCWSLEGSSNRAVTQRVDSLYYLCLSKCDKGCLFWVVFLVHYSSGVLGCHSGFFKSCLVKPETEWSLERLGLQTHFFSTMKKEHCCIMQLWTVFKRSTLWMSKYSSLVAVDFTRMPGGVTFGNSGLCCCVPCLLSTNFVSFCLLNRVLWVRLTSWLYHPWFDLQISYQ